MTINVKCFAVQCATWCVTCSFANLPPQIKHHSIMLIGVACFHHMELKDLIQTMSSFPLFLFVELNEGFAILTV